jgi:hypothetical protein
VKELAGIGSIRLCGSESTRQLWMDRIDIGLIFKFMSGCGFVFQPLAAHGRHAGIHQAVRDGELGLGD